MSLAENLLPPELGIHAPKADFQLKIGTPGSISVWWDPTSIKAGWVAAVQGPPLCQALPGLLRNGFHFTISLSVSRSITAYSEDSTVQSSFVSQQNKVLVPPRKNQTVNRWVFVSRTPIQSRKQNTTGRTIKMDKCQILTSHQGKPSQNQGQQVLGIKEAHVKP